MLCCCSCLLLLLLLLVLQHQQQQPEEEEEEEQATEDHEVQGPSSLDDSHPASKLQVTFAEQLLGGEGIRYAFISHAVGTGFGDQVPTFATIPRSVDSSWLFMAVNDEAMAELLQRHGFDSILRKWKNRATSNLCTNTCASDLAQAAWTQQARLGGAVLRHPYCLISHTADPEDLLRNQFDIDGFSKGLVEAATRTSAWVITGGTASGVMEIVGKAMRKHDKAAFEESCPANPKKMDAAEAKPEGTAVDDRPLAALQENHSHFIICDNGKVGSQTFGTEIPFRTRFEDHVAKGDFNDIEGSLQVRVPRVMILLNGGKISLESLVQAALVVSNALHEAVKEFMPQDTLTTQDIEHFDPVHAALIAASACRDTAEREHGSASYQDGLAKKDLELLIGYWDDARLQESADRFEKLAILVLEDLAQSGKGVEYLFQDIGWRTFVSKTTYRRAVDQYWMTPVPFHLHFHHGQLDHTKLFSWRSWLSLRADSKGQAKELKICDFGPWQFFSIPYVQAWTNGIARCLFVALYSYAVFYRLLAVGSICFMEVLLFLWALGLALVELRQLENSGFHSYIHDFWNILDALHITVQSLVYLDSDDDLEDEEEANEDYDVLHEEHTLRLGQVQVVLLSFCQTSEAQVEALLDAAGGGRAAEVESILERQQEPDLDCVASRTICGIRERPPRGDTPFAGSVDKHKTTHDAANPLHIAAGKGRLRVARLLLEANAEKGKVVRLWLEEKADKDRATRDAANPLHIAAGKGRLRVARLLLEANAEKGKVVRLWLEEKADKDRATRDAANPLHIAAGKGRLLVARLLLEANADKDKAHQSGQLEIVRLLLQAKAEKDKVLLSALVLGLLLADQSRDMNKPEQVLEVMHAMNLLPCWIRVLQVLQNSEHFGTLLITIFGMAKDALKFFILVFIFCCAFSCAITPILFSQIEERDNQGLTWAFWTIVGSMDEAALAQLKTLPPITRTTATILVYILALVCNVLLVNLLIAVMNSTYEKNQSMSQTSWAFSRIEAVLEYDDESTLPPPLNLVGLLLVQSYNPFKTDDFRQYEVEDI
ncbi:Transient receptor potential cation channel subfamily M member 3 [Symbiodinium microadriaticum]|uniref:Transient receptor potential cation channel subfamily M member 3 n=1 Tax=Symbiodinium microadriaticum TaxID=2951 RepID=A0A1Q9ETE1_SYMMI|nr:Transient receptor potential cation channel subfamily M member 3 [Symbiodinium microadriaticum]